MALVSARIHRVLDVVTVFAFALAPMLVPMDGLAANLAYVLAAVHLVVTLSTAFPDWAGRPLPLRAHGAIEAAVGIALVVLPFVVGWHGAGRAFYVIAGVVILLVRGVTDYAVARKGESQTVSVRGA